MADMLNMKLNYLHIFQHNQQIAAGLPEQLVGNPANPRDNMTGSDWARQAFDWRWDVTYYGPTQVALNVAPCTYTPGTVPSYGMFDSSIGIRTNAHIAFRMVVDNVFNRGISSPYAFDPNRQFEAIQFEAILARSFKLNG